MRKFTKEISALIATAAIGTAAGIGAFSASSEEIVQTAGVDMNPDATICATELPPLAGEPLPPDDLIEATTEEEIPPLMGDIAPPEWIEVPTEELPPLAGEPLPPDEWIETTTEEDLPPVEGLMVYADGDINGDGSLNMADIVLFQKWLLNQPGLEINDLTAADLYMDGKLDVFDLTLMKKAYLKQFSNSYIIPDGYIATFHGDCDDESKETYIYKIDNGAANYGFKYINVARSNFNIDHTEQVTFIGDGEVMWTDNVFMAAEENGAYDYVTVPNDEKKYTIEEFMSRFLMN